MLFSETQSGGVRLDFLTGCGGGLAHDEQVRCPRVTQAGGHAKDICVVLHPGAPTEVVSELSLVMTAVYM